MNDFEVHTTRERIAHLESIADTYILKMSEMEMVFDFNETAYENLKQGYERVSARAFLLAKRMYQRSLDDAGRQHWQVRLQEELHCLLQWFIRHSRAHPAWPDLMAVYDERKAELQKLEKK